MIEKQAEGGEEKGQKRLTGKEISKYITYLYEDVTRKPFYRILRITKFWCTNYQE